MEINANRNVRFYGCGCFTTDNIFLEDYSLHVRFVTEQQFRRDYRAILLKLGCDSDEKFKDVLNKISQEVDRRIHLDEASAERTAAIKRTYRPLHPHVYHLEESYLTPEFKTIVEYCRNIDASKDGLLKFLEEEAGKRIWSLCKLLKKLLKMKAHFEDHLVPFSTTILLNELGFDETFITPLREQYLLPLTSLLYPDCGGRCLDSHKAFVVKYDMNEDLDLSYHYDNAEVTLNVSIGKDFTEGNLYFGDMRQVPVSETKITEAEHRITEGLLHRGQHMHGALPISHGQRWNLIIWMRASQERNKLCPMCNSKPSLVEGRGFADGFTKANS
uniref:2-oxoglutarate and iron-dependent oxygenase domain containing 2 n=1 Tax=Oryzias melastigma TaxID=30732 RepID=A0A3B3CZZ5_ORYME